MAADFHDRLARLQATYGRAADHMATYPDTTRGHPLPGWSLQQLLQARSVVSAFDREQFDRLVTLCREVGFVPAFAGLIRISHVQPRRDCLALAEGAIRDKLSYRDVVRIIRRRSRRRPPSEGVGRPAKRPKSPEEALDLVRDATSRWLTQVEAVAASGLLSKPMAKRLKSVMKQSRTLLP